MYAGQEDMKRCSATLIINHFHTCQNDYHQTKDQQEISVGEATEKEESLCTAGAVTMENSIEKKLKLSFDPAIPSSEYIPKGKKAGHQIVICTSMLLLFTIVMIWIQPKYPQIYKQIKKWRYDYTTKYYCLLTKEDIPCHV